MLQGPPSYLGCSSITPAARTCPAAAPQLVGHKLTLCPSLRAPLCCTLPPLQHPLSLSPPTWLLRFCPCFSRWKQRLSLHLPTSQLLFLLFSASYYPGDKNNKEFTALDLGLGQAQRSSFALCQLKRLVAPAGFCISASPGPCQRSIKVRPRRQSHCSLRGVGCALWAQQSWCVTPGVPMPRTSKGFGFPSFQAPVR